MPPAPRPARRTPAGFTGVDRSTLEGWIDAYVDELAAQGLREKSLTTYRKVLRRLLPELARVRSGAELLRAVRGLAGPTRSLYLTTARGFESWCAASRRIRGPVLADRVRVRLDDELPDPLTVPEASRLDRAARAPLPRGLQGAARDRALRVRLLYWTLRDTGARLDETLGLVVGDVMVDAGEEGVRFRRPKGRRERVVPLLPGSSLALTLLRRALRSRPAGALLFPGRWGGRWSESAARRALAGVAGVAGVARFHPHRLRHTKATELTRAGVPPDVRMRIMGWASVDEGRRYELLLAADVRAALARHGG